MTLDRADNGPRLMLVVQPRLLGDTLARALRAQGLTVIVAEDEASADADDGFDVAILSGPSPDTIDVPLVIRLPAPADHGIGTVTRRGHPAQSVPLTDVRSVLATVQVEPAGDG